MKFDINVQTFYRKSKYFRLIILNIIYDQFDAIQLIRCFFFLFLNNSFVIDYKLMILMNIIIN